MYVCWMHMKITIAFLSALSAWNSNKNDDDNIYWEFFQTNLWHGATTIILVS